MRKTRLLPAASALILVAACGGSSDSGDHTAALPGSSASPESVGTAAPGTRPTTSATAPQGTATRPGGPSPQPAATRAPASKLGAAPSQQASPRTSPAASPQPRPAGSPKPSPRPQPSPSPTRAPSPAPPVGPTHPLEMTAGYRFSPMDLTIAVGDAVRAHNSDTIDHTFTGPSWDSGNVAPGASSRVFRFNTAGTFRFVCTPHEGLGMTGTLTVR